jgi:uroporphyrinogen-III synthase
MRRLLVLRPEPGASATVAKAKQLGLNATAIPLFKIVRLDWAAPEPSRFDALLLTSANAIRHSGEKLGGLRGLPVYAVGATTAETAREAGFDIAATGEGGVDRLLGSIEPDLKLLHLCGADHHEPEGPRQAITRLPVYRAEPIGDPDLAGAEGAVALIHSPRAGQRFAQLIEDKGAIALVAISDAAAKATGDGWEKVAVAEQPSDDALLALAAPLCNNSAAQ